MQTFSFLHLSRAGVSKPARFGSRLTSALLLLLFVSALTVSVRAAQIHDAASAGDVARLNALLATNQNLVHLPGEDALTPLHSAARAGKLAAAEYLIEHGAVVNAPDDHGCTPLHSAVYGSHGDMVEFLLEHQANANALRKDGTAPIYYAAQNGATNLVLVLLKHGAKPGAASSGAESPLAAASRRSYIGVAEALVSAGADLNAKNEQGQTPLHAAARAGQTEMVAWLLRYGADAGIRDESGMKPVDHATGTTNVALVAVFDAYSKLPADECLPVRVGEAGDPDRIVFLGLHSFRADELRHALAVKPSYLLIGHPQANLRVFLDKLQGLLESGYQAKGFPDARVAVSYQRAQLQVQAQISEGPQFRADRVRVVGAKAVPAKELINWFTQPAPESASKRTVYETHKSSSSTNQDSGEVFEAKVEATWSENRREGSLNAPGKVMRPDDPLWKRGEPANFSAAWAKDAVAQVEACLAEQGFFFGVARVTIERNAAKGTADLVIHLTQEGPPGVIGKIKVIGNQENSTPEILRFLGLREGGRISAKTLADARIKLNDCGRFWRFAVQPTFTGGETVTSRRVNLTIRVAEQPGVPKLGKPLAPKQQALLQLCKWVEQFPEREDEISLALRDPEELPGSGRLVLSPRHGLIFDFAVREPVPLSFGVLLNDESIQLCSWASGNSFVAPSGGGGKLFLHLKPGNGDDGDRYGLSVGGGYSSEQNPAEHGKHPLLAFDVQLSRAAFLDLEARADSQVSLAKGILTVTNAGFYLRSDAKTGRILELSRQNDSPRMECDFRGQGWARAVSDFNSRAASLTNRYVPGHGLSSFLSLAAGELGRIWLARNATVTNAADQWRGLAAAQKLCAPEILGAVDAVIRDFGTNKFFIPTDEVDLAMAQNNLAALFTGWFFKWGNHLFPKYSWPWTATREGAFLLMSQGRYTDLELERLYQSEDTGPLGCLALARLLSAAGSPAVKGFALQGLARMGKQSFLRDCQLFLRGDAGLATSFARMAGVLRAMPATELDSLLKILPEAEAQLLREAATALRTKPDAPLDQVLAPALGNYWENSLRAKVRAAFYQLINHTRSAAS